MHPLPETCLNIKKSCAEPIAPEVALRTGFPRGSRGIARARRLAHPDGWGDGGLGYRVPAEDQRA
ncbi:hypothetical protein GCM10010309_61320 [Streptomyces violaceochromogenes]|nr:hypothetical protein GCM10010309_61320 [Streptomyces violaceochromogenes]